MVQEQDVALQEQDHNKTNQIGVEGKLCDVMSVQIGSSQMSEVFQSAAVEITAGAITAHLRSASVPDLKQIATEIKREYDKRYSTNGKATDGVYYCVVGESFACKEANTWSCLKVCLGAVSHEFRQHIWLQWRNLHIVIWKSKDCPFDLNDG